MNYSSTDFEEQLIQRKEYLEKLLLKAKEKSIQFNNLPMHKIHVQKYGNQIQYCIREGATDTSGKYIKKDQLGIVRQTIQQEYLQKSIKIVQEELDFIAKYLDKRSPSKLVHYYDGLAEGRKCMIDPLELSDDEYARQWQSECYMGRDFLEGDPEYYTQRNERVRSKSEIIIANLLDQYGVPYHYEYPIRIKGYGVVYPDFTTLNVRTRTQIHWEHLGLIDDPAYRENAIKKLEMYEKNGIYLGKNLIVTLENTKHPLNVKSVISKIEKYLL